MTVESTATENREIAFVASLPKWNRYLNQLMAAEISEVTRYYNRIVQWSPRKTDQGYLLQILSCPEKKVARNLEDFPDLSSEGEKRSAVLLNGTFNHEFDIQKLLQDFIPKLSRTSRIIVVAYNPYLSWLYRLTNWLGLRKGELPSTFITHTDLTNITKLAGYQVVRIRNVGYFPLAVVGD